MQDNCRAINLVKAGARIGRLLKAIFVAPPRTAIETAFLSVIKRAIGSNNDYPGITAAMRNHRKRPMIQTVTLEKAILRALREHAAERIDSCRKPRITRGSKSGTRFCDGRQHTRHARGGCVGRRYRKQSLVKPGTRVKDRPHEPKFPGRHDPICYS